MPDMAIFEISGSFLDDMSQKIRKMANYMYRPDFPLTFSARSIEEIWPFPGYGYSKTQERYLLDDLFLRAVVREYLVVDPNLGRFHVCAEGVYKGEQKRLKELFIKFERGLRLESDWKVLKSLDKRPTNAERLAILHNRS